MAHDAYSEGRPYSEAVAWCGNFCSTFSHVSVKLVSRRSRSGTSDTGTRTWQTSMVLHQHMGMRHFTSHVQFATEVIRASPNATDTT